MSEEYVQWDFGDLFSEKNTRKVYSVEELTIRIRQFLEKEFGTIWITGEVSGLRIQSSGHYYFTLKDANAQIQCVLFKGTRNVERRWIEDGRKLTIQGELSVYEQRGQYQLIVREVEEAGEGKLAIEFEKLKRKLKAEGLFDEARKRPIPKYPRRIGIVTSPSGAALQDILRVFRQDYPGLEVILAPSKVQGEGAAADIVKAIRLLNRYQQEADDQAKLDVILVTRGGGSIEDLWCFNEESVARAIVASVVPVISAVGHEIDFCISDLVADLRCATPTGAAQYLTQNILTVQDELSTDMERMELCMNRLLLDNHAQLQIAYDRFMLLSPLRHLEDLSQRLDDLHLSMQQMIFHRLEDSRQELTYLNEHIKHQCPLEQIHRAQDETVEWKRRAKDDIRNYLHTQQSKLDLLNRSLELLDPKSNLKRGYSITVKASDGSIIRHQAQLHPGMTIKTLLQDGTIHSEVKTSDRSSF